MFFLFNNRMIRVDHVTTIALPFDLGPSHTPRYEVGVSMINGEKLAVRFVNEGEAMKHYVSLKEAVGADSP